MWSPKTRVHPHAPVIALDIDGTIGRYHDHFKWFAELYLQCPLPMIFKDEIEGEFSDALGLPKHVYRDIKLAYRQGGMKRSLPVWPGTQQMVGKIHSQGYQLWICTTRPWLRLDNVDKDTAFWLEHNNIAYDGVLFGEDKYQDLVDIVGIDRVVCVVDDLPDHIKAAQALGIPAAMRSGEHNEYWCRESREINRVSSMFEMGEFIQKNIKAHELKNREGTL